MRSHLPAFAALQSLPDRQKRSSGIDLCEAANSMGSRCFSCAHGVAPQPDLLSERSDAFQRHPPPPVVLRCPLPWHEAELNR